MDERFTEQPDGRQVAGPPVIEPAPKARAPRFRLAAAVGLVIAVATSVYFFTRPESAPAPPVVPGPAPQAGLPQGTLETVTQEIVEAEFVEDDSEKANRLANAAEAVGGCELQGYLRYREKGDLADPAVRDDVTQQVETRGWDIAFGHAKGHWVAIVQVCGGAG